MKPASHTYRFSLASEVDASAVEVWAHALSMAGVNRELFPLARMTSPPGVAVLDPGSVQLGRPLFRSWILLFGLLPIDYDDLTFVEFEPGRRFLEASPLLSQREWVHERIVEPKGSGCRISDSISFVPRVTLLGPVYLPVFRLVFRLRHRNLSRIFGRLLSNLPMQRTRGEQA